MILHIHACFPFDCMVCLVVLREQTLFLSYEMALHSFIVEQSLAVLDTCN